MNGSLWAQESSFDFDDFDFESEIEQNENEALDFGSEEDFNFDEEESASFQDEDFNLQNENFEEDLESFPVSEEPKLSPETRFVKSEGGLYIYHPNQDKGLYKISRSNEYHYKYKKSPQNGFINVKGGNFNLENFPGKSIEPKYLDLYGSTNLTAFYFEYEAMPFKGLKKSIPNLNFVLGAGLSYAHGSGRFVVNDPTRPEGSPKEGYSLMLFPLSLGLTYKIKLTHDPLFMPYVTAAADYNFLIEVRSGFKDFNYSGIAGAHLAGGLSLNLGWLERQAALTMDRDYGINNTYLSVEARYLTSFYKDWDLNGMVIVGGLSFEY